MAPLTRGLPADLFFTRIPFREESWRGSGAQYTPRNLSTARSAYSVNRKNIQDEVLPVEQNASIRRNPHVSGIGKLLSSYQAVPEADRSVSPYWRHRSVVSIDSRFGGLLRQAAQRLATKMTSAMLLPIRSILLILCGLSPFSSIIIGRTALLPRRVFRLLLTSAPFFELEAVAGERHPTGSGMPANLMCEL
jgi:hypothetical protein